MSTVTVTKRRLIVLGATENQEFRCNMRIKIDKYPAEYNDE